MQYEGTLRGHVIKWGEPLDLCCYSILRSEYATDQETTA
jgi:RimJ/RimL family protein N-acetyltransferase